MELILWRHADAEDGTNDLNRKLTKKGIRQAADMGAWLRTRLPDPWKIVTSPAVRAIQTAKSLSTDMEITKEIAPGADHHAILSAANWPYSSLGVVLVGHQPTLGDAVGYLLGSKYPQLAFPKSSIFWFSNQSTYNGNQLVLRSVMRPDLL